MLRKGGSSVVCRFVCRLSFVREPFFVSLVFFNIKIIVEREGWQVSFTYLVSQFCFGVGCFLWSLGFSFGALLKTVLF